MLFYSGTDTFSLCISALQCFNLLAFANEIKAPTAYSKFASTTPRSVPSKVGMLIIYMPAMCSAAYCVVGAATADHNGRELLVAAMLFLHFAKRVAETLLVHQYSGLLDGGAGSFIGLFYALVTLLISSQQASVPRAVYCEVTAETLLPIGVVLFIAGEFGNLYHHVLLAQMRPPAKLAQPVRGMSAGGLQTQSTAEALAAPPTPSPSAYVVPEGGLFSLVTMPHYLCELAAWLGVALVAQQLNALLVFAGMASYLSGRAVATTRWYRAKFGKAWPAQRRHLVPFIF